jgi:DNA polymerase-3 subunit epsilon
VYAIVDIETTGGNKDFGRITEIAILLHDGCNVIKKYHSLVNPHCKIPYHITKLTGITNEMIWDAPAFYEIAKDIVEFTDDAVFVAHNVRFDYGFVKAAFKELGYVYQRPTLCTVQLSRTAFPGLFSYSLGKLCESLDIQILNRHRAMGDAEATAILFSKIAEQNPELITAGLLSKEIKKISQPPLLKPEIFEKVPPQITGVYYFYNAKGEVIYVGKSKDVKKRLLQHFSSQGNKKAIRMLHEISDITYENTGNELVALLLESSEIKNLKPLYNVSQKRTRAIPYYGIFQKYDKQGYINLFIKKLRQGEEPLIATEDTFEANAILDRIVEKFNLCLAKCGQHKTGGPCFDRHLHKCLGACVAEERTVDYNQRARKAIKSFSFESENFFIVGEGRNKTEKSLVCIERGKYKGFGYIDTSFNPPSIDDMHDCIKKYDHNRNIQQILCSHVKLGLIKIPFESGQLELFAEVDYEWTE